MADWKKITKVVTIGASIIATVVGQIGNNLPEKKEEKK